MFIKMLASFFNLQWKNYYHGKLSYLWEVVSIFFTLTIFWYTAKAFSPAIDTKLAKYGTDYFTYIVVGEIFLTIPFFLFENFTRQVRLCVVEKTFDTLLSLPVNPIKVFVMLCISGLPREFLRALVTGLLAFFIFDLNLNGLSVLAALILQIVAIPIYLGFGMIVCSMVLSFGRGQTLMGHFNTLNAFLAGAFFPIEVLPTWLQSMSHHFSPFTLLLEGTRQTLMFGIGKNYFTTLGLILLWTIFFPVGWLALKKAISIIKKNGNSIIITS